MSSDDKNSFPGFYAIDDDVNINALEKLSQAQQVVAQNFLTAIDNIILILY